MKLITKEDKKEADAIDQWMADNYVMLTEWLSNVVTIRESDARQTPSLFQTFTVPIRSEPPYGLIQAGNEMKHILLLHSIFGKAVLPESGVVSDALNKPTLGDPPQSACFSGFKQQVGRLPIEGDIVLYTAVKWFELSFKQNPLLLAGDGVSKQSHSILETICTIDCLPKDVGQT